MYFAPHLFPKSKPTHRSAAPAIQKACSQDFPAITDKAAPGETRPISRLPPAVVEEDKPDRSRDERGRFQHPRASDPGGGRAIRPVRSLTWGLKWFPGADPGRGWPRSPVHAPGTEGEAVGLSSRSRARHGDRKRGGSARAQRQLWRAEQPTPRPCGRWGWRSGSPPAFSGPEWLVLVFGGPPLRGAEPSFCPQVRSFSARFPRETRARERGTF